MTPFDEEAAPQNRWTPAPAGARAFIDPRPIVLVIGALVFMLGAAMLLPAFADFIVGDADWQIFGLSSLFTMSCGGVMFLATRGSGQGLSTRQAFVMTALVWVMLALFASLPFYWSGVVPSFTDAYFESISGLTTTGATVMTGLDDMPPGILLWRGIMQWLGGLGIIVMAVSVLPMLQIGGMQLFKAEAFDTPEKILPRAQQISGFMTLIFLNLTGLCMLAYLMAGMSFLDALVHAMTTVATGGFSTRDASLGYFDSTAIDMIATTFMVVGSLPFLLYVQALQGSWKPLGTDGQVRAFLTLLCGTIIFAWSLEIAYGVRAGWEALRFATVNVTSILTGTGYATTAYDGWGPAAVAFFFFLMFIGGCAGSTSCGIKIFRFQVLFQNVKQHLAQVLYPNGIFTQKFNGRPIADDVTSAVMSFFFLYIFTFAVSATALSIAGVDTLTALSGAGSAISNVGPGLGALIGPAGNYQPLPDVAKWILLITMLIGRLELFTVLVILSPRFWRA
ncbi:TrkH family potassium uptake protein [Ahrensia sp. R2A130]|uniref:TrkH family potassium uptake protein n=1 Tax=Ahrensia sp. R2A130 TaxID=744979 RepID=UPI0001E0F0C4|nr:TrkH family potassium uptake protein [Ahrensia sp. R2A130]EFL89177.1 Trk system potassium uptake protein TrkH [Ahrensia sp. R2A130]